MTNNIPPVSRALNEMNIPHQVFWHDGPIRSVEQAARERGQTPEQVVRSIVFRLAKGEYVMALMAGPGQISWSALRRYLGRSRVTMASKDEVLSVTGYQSGAVGPFGLPSPMRILVDESVPALGELSFGSGEKGVAIIIRGKTFIRALGKVEMLKMKDEG